MKKPIPKKVKLISGRVITISIRDLPTGHMGYWDPATSTINIAKKQPAYSKWVTLFHEMLHAVNDELILDGKKKISFPERSIEFASKTIFGFMLINNLTDLADKRSVKKEMLEGIYAKKYYK